MLDNAELQSPSPAPAAPPAGEALAPPEPASEEPEEKGAWWSRLWNTRGSGHRVADPETSPDLAEGPPEPIAHSVTLTEEELNQRVARQAQSLHDRDVARRNREAQEAQRRQLRDEDPWGYAEQERQREESDRTRAEQTQQLMGLLGHTARQHDAATLDPLVLALPEKERQRILGLPNAGQGLGGRKLIVDEALKSYGRQEYERGFRAAQAQLRKDSAFRKSVMSEYRGNFEEPELYPGDAPREGAEDNISNRLRTAFYQR